MTEQELSIVRKQPLPWDETANLGTLLADFVGDRKEYIDAAINVYNWGVIQGKRAERFKRQKGGPYSKFRAYMIKNGIKIQEIAELLDRTVSHINQILNGTGGDFSMADVRKICIRYGISSDSYFK